MNSAFKKMMCRFLAVALITLPFQTGQASMISTDQVSSAATVQANRSLVLNHLNRAQTVSEFQALGLDAQQARDRVAAMTEKPWFKFYNKNVSGFVKNFFKDRGFQVFIALNGEEALSLVKKERPEIVLLDIKMKGMDGVAALKHIKEIDKSIKIIMVTALEDQDKMNEAYKLGACDYITKPLVLDYLEQAVLKNLKG